MGKKVILEFNIEDNTDNLASVRAMKATDIYLACHAFTEELRKVCKYSENNNEVKHAEKWRSKFKSYLEDYEISLDQELE